MIVNFNNQSAMENHILKTPGAYEEIDIRCPKCSSDSVLISVSSSGYYEVLECRKCGYRKIN